MCLSVRPICTDSRETCVYERRPTKNPSKKKRPDGFKRDLPMHANIHTFMCSCTGPLKRTALSKEINPWIQKYDYKTV